MRNYTARLPLVRLLFPFILGIILAYSFRIEIGIYFFLTVTSLSLVLLFKQRSLLQRGFRWIGFDGIIIFISLFTIGMEMTSLKLQTDFSSPLNSIEKVSGMNVRLLNDPVVKEKSVKLIVDLLEWKNKLKWNVGQEKMIVYLERDASSESLKYGDEIIIHTSPQPIEGPKNPEEFDYRSWLERQGVREQAYAKRADWKLEMENQGNWFKKSALDLRRYFLEKLQSYGWSGSSFGVAAALLLGASDHLDPGTIQAYSASGTLHVLSVSGMHVALVYIVLLRLLAPLQKIKSGKWISIFIQLIFLWFYAALTGMCPSVLRSVTMLSVVIAGRAFNKNAHILNSLSASALILLLTDPLLLFDVGFQLSYLAVAGIVILQPPLEKMWKPKFWLTKQIWTIISVTIVAQIFTFPLGLYYFNQFPIYFLLSNLIIIPLSTVCMYVGLFLLIVSPCLVIAKPVAVLFGFLVEVLNRCVTGIEHLPFSVFHSAKWEKTEMLLLYVSIISILIFVLQKNKKMLPLGLTTFLALLIEIAFSKNNYLHRREVVIFNVNHSTAVLVLNGSENLFLCDTLLLKRKGDFDFHVEPFLRAQAIQLERMISLEDSLVTENDFVAEGKNRMNCFGAKMIFVDRNFKSGVRNEKCNILVLQQNTQAKLDSLISNSKPDWIVADGSNSEWKIKRWEQICEKQNVKFYSTDARGAFVLFK